MQRSSPSRVLGSVLPPCKAERRQTRKSHPGKSHLAYSCSRHVGEEPCYQGAVRPILATFGIALALRVWVAWLVGPTSLVGDEWDYVARGARWALGQAPQDGFRAPMFEWIIGALITLLGKDSPQLRMAAAGISAMVVWPTYLLARLVGNQRTALLAALLVGTTGASIAYAHLLWGEGIYSVLAITAVYLTARCLQERSLHWSAPAGLVWAVLALYREVALVALAITCIWIVLWQARPHLRQLGLLLALALIPVFTWSAWLNRTNTADDAWALVSRTTYLNLYIGNGPPTAKQEYQRLASRAAEREARAKPRVHQIIVEQPNWIWTKLKKHGPRFVSPGGFPIRRLFMALEKPTDRWSYRLRPPHKLTESRTEELATLYAVQNIALIALGLLGWVLFIGQHKSRSIGMVALAFILGHWIPTVVTFAATRFREPLVPLLCVGAPIVLVQPRETWSRAQAVARILALAAALAAGYLAVSQFDQALSSRWL